MTDRHALDQKTDEQGPLDPGIVMTLTSEAAGMARARGLLARAEWAAHAYGRYDKAAVDRIVTAVAAAAEGNARHYAEWAVAETGYGVVADKVVKNLACSTGMIKAYGGHDYVTVRLDPSTGIVEVPRPAGVVLALTPATSPVATIFSVCLLSLMTRNAVVICPHPLAKGVGADAARTLAGAAVAAGAPDGVIQVIDDPSGPLVDAMMDDCKTSVVVATGSAALLRSAYSSGTPAWGAGPGNVPVLVDATADLAEAARHLVNSKSFDNSILSTSESVLIVEEPTFAELLGHLQGAGAHLLEPVERDRMRELLFAGDHFDARWVGREAASLASEVGVEVAPGTRVLLAPFDRVVPEEPLTREKPCPVLGLVTVPTVKRGIDAARAVVRIGGRGHSAAIHSSDLRTVVAYGAALEVFRVSVNVGATLGSSGIETNLAPTMTLGTGFSGGSCLGENLEPRHLVGWTRMAYSRDAEAPFGRSTNLDLSDPELSDPDLSDLDPWEHRRSPVPPYPVASNLLDRGDR